MKRYLFILLLLASTLFADDPATGDRPPISLTELAAKSDLVALAQVRDTDYLERREIPVSGSAYLKILIPYKGSAVDALVEVYEKGLHARECYFPKVSVFEEGRRYLLFLQRDTEDAKRFRGLPEGCALEVLVDSDNRYALRYPVTGISLSDSLDSLAREMAFSDGYATVDDEDLAPDLRNSMLTQGLIRAYQPTSKAQGDPLLPSADAGARLWQYTTGIPLGEVRRLIDPETLAH